MTVFTVAPPIPGVSKLPIGRGASWTKSTVILCMGTFASDLLLTVIAKREVVRVEIRK